MRRNWADVFDDWGKDNRTVKFNRDFGWGLLREFISTLNRVDRKSTRLNSSHLVISYAVFCLKKKKLNTAAGPILARGPCGETHPATPGLLRFRRASHLQIARLSRGWFPRPMVRLTCTVAREP